MSAFGTKADITLTARNVRFSEKNGHHDFGMLLWIKAEPK